VCREKRHERAKKKKKEKEKRQQEKNLRREIARSNYEVI